MGQVSFTDEAREDLLAIEGFLAERNPRVAAQFIDSILERCRQLQLFPELGPVRLDMKPEARCLTHKRWLILYRLIPGGVEVVRIVDGARDLGETAGVRASRPLLPSLRRQHARQRLRVNDVERFQIP